MTIWEALLLGIVQGITEFLPVSSSGHLILFQHLLGFKELHRLVFFDLFCHVGTLGAIFLVFRKEIQQTLSSKSQFLKVMVATLPLFPLIPFVKSIQGSFGNLQLLGWGFLATSLLLFLGNRFEGALRASKKGSFNDAFLIGISQACAVIPGLSRSGSTISVGRILGMAPIQAVTFSFILSIPTILGGMALESYKALSHTSQDLPWTLYIAGSFSAFVMGFISLKGLLWIVQTAKFQIFAWYCACLGILVLLIYS